MLFPNLMVNDTIFSCDNLFRTKLLYCASCYKKNHVGTCKLWKYKFCKKKILTNILWLMVNNLPNFLVTNCLGHYIVLFAIRKIMLALVNHWNTNFARKFVLLFETTYSLVINFNCRPPKSWLRFPIMRSSRVLQFW